MSEAATANGSVSDASRSYGEGVQPVVEKERIVSFDSYEGLRDPTPCP